MKMTVSEFVAEYGKGRELLEEFLLKNDYTYRYKIDAHGNKVKIENEIAQTRIESILDEYEKWVIDHKEEVEAIKEKKKAMAGMLITSGFSFDGYKITKYSGYISGDDAIQVSRGQDSYFGNITNVGEALMDSLKKIRRVALQELKEAAYDLGCNAVIGVDFDYITLEPETANSSGGTTYLPYVFGVTANGNAVIIEKIED